MWGGGITITQRDGSDVEPRRRSVSSRAGKEPPHDKDEEDNRQQRAVRPVSARAKLMAWVVVQVIVFALSLAATDFCLASHGFQCFELLGMLRAFVGPQPGSTKGEQK